MENKRFRVVDADSIEAGAVGADLDSGRWLIVEFSDDGTPLRFVGADGGEPEDQTLYRDWDWVPREMNVLADALAVARQREQELREALDVACNYLESAVGVIEDYADGDLDEENADSRKMIEEWRQLAALAPASKEQP